MQKISVCIFRPAGRKFFHAQWTDPVTGRKKTKSTQAIIRREAERFAGQLEKELQEGTYWEQQRITWKEFRDRYESEVVSGQSKGAAIKVASTFSLVEQLINPKYLAAVDSSQISRFIQKLREGDRSEATIKGYLAYLKSSLRWASRMGMLASVPRIEMPKRTTGMKGRPITKEEFERMLDKVSEVVGDVVAEHWRHFMWGLWWSGLRRTEAMYLHWTDDRLLCVDFTGKRPMMRIRADAQKSHKDELLPMTPEFAEFLLQTPKAEREGYVFSPIGMKQGTGRLKPQRVSRIISSIGKEAGVKVAENTSGKVKYASAHDLRRAFGFRWAMRVMPTVLQQMMRHESIDTTMQYYVGRNAEAAADVLWDAVSEGRLQPSLRPT